MTNLKTLSESAAELGKGARESVEELGRSAGRKMDSARDETAGALHAAATSVRSTGRKGSEAIDNFAKGTANRLDATATYVEDHDIRDLYKGLRRFGHKHLTASVVAALAVGFLAGAALNKAAHTCANTPEEAA